MKPNHVVRLLCASVAGASVLLAAGLTYAQGYPPGQYPPQQYPPQQYPPQQYPPQQYPPQQYPPQQYPPQQYPPQQYPPQQYPPQQTPPPPKSNELQWSIRVNPLDLLFGQADGVVDYAPLDFLSVGVGPTYRFGDPWAAESGVNVGGGGVFGELGLWLEGRPLRGWFLKGHFEYQAIKYTTKDETGAEYDHLNLSRHLVGALIGAQHLIGKVFTYQWGFGLVYDFNAEEHELKFRDSPTKMGTITIKKPGPLANGLDLITQLGIGVSF